MYAEQDERPTESDDLTSVEHEHDCPELILVRGGTAKHHYEGIDYPISMGDVFCVHNEHTHSFHQMENLHLSNVMYDPTRLRLPERDLRKIPGYNALFTLEPTYRLQHKFSSRLSLYPKDTALAAHLIDQMNSELKKQRSGFEAIVTGYLVQFFVFLSRRYDKHPGKEAAALLKIGKVMGALEEKSYKTWTLPELAEIGDLSVNQLIQAFHQATNMPPIEYLIRMRIHNSMELLTESTLSITEIAFEVGFNDSNYFSRQFKRINSTTPSEFRRFHRTTTFE